MTSFGLKLPHVDVMPNRPTSVHLLGIFNGNDGYSAIHSFLESTLKSLSNLTHIVVQHSCGEKTVALYYNLTGDLCMIHSVQGEIII